MIPVSLFLKAVQLFCIIIIIIIVIIIIILINLAHIIEHEGFTHPLLSPLTCSNILIFTMENLHNYICTSLEQPVTKAFWRR